ncbi:MAG: TM2 domain-containing protein [Chitinophagaceae bacterium]|nr:TM2 domain-containing protein [Chitinophagaceae bacterium]
MKKISLLIALMMLFNNSKYTFGAIPIKNFESKIILHNTNFELKDFKKETIVKNLIEKRKYTISYFIKNKLEPSKQTIATLLALFLGHLGVHRFYLKSNTIGFIQLGLTFLGVTLFFLGALFTTVGFFSFISIIGIFILMFSITWSRIDFIRLLFGEDLSNNNF